MNGAAKNAAMPAATKSRATANTASATRRLTHQRERSRMAKSEFSGSRNAMGRDFMGSDPEGSDPNTMYTPRPSREETAHDPTLRFHSARPDQGGPRPRKRPGRLVGRRHHRALRRLARRRHAVRLEPRAARPARFRA